MVSAFAMSSNIWGQCNNINYNKDVYRSVSDKYQKKLTQRFELFLQKKCEEKIDELYDMLISSFRDLNRKDDFVNDMKAYYSGNDRFVSFKPTKISEFSSSKDNLVSFWFIEGCITEVINGKKRFIKTILEANLEGEEIFFTDITTRPNPLGENKKCKP
jgi:hypothetical protein